MRSSSDVLTYFICIGRIHRFVHRDIKQIRISKADAGSHQTVDFGLVKLLAPDDRTITLLQGRGTALYAIGTIWW